jgi:hypothetical protein
MTGDMCATNHYSYTDFCSKVFLCCSGCLFCFSGLKKLLRALLLYSFCAASGVYWQLWILILALCCFAVFGVLGLMEIVISSAAC